MKDLAYKNFSRRRHEGNVRRGQPSACQFELTFGCGLHCAHCYSDCYNNPRDIQKELKTKQVKKILDMLARESILWLCLTGGDPLSRPDFSEIYRYAVSKGFLVTLFTSAFHVTDEIVALLKQMPPFAIEVTMNAGHRDVFEKVARRKGSFERVRQGIVALKDAGLPVKLKMQVTRQTVGEFPWVRRFAAETGLRFEESAILYPRLNGDAGPCRLRLTEETLAGRDLSHDDCRWQSSQVRARGKRARPLFPCVVESVDGIFVDPQGQLFLCPLMRDISIDTPRPTIRTLQGADKERPLGHVASKACPPTGGEPRAFSPGGLHLTKVSLREGLKRLSGVYVGRTFQTDSLCRDCSLALHCLRCPGKAWLEMKDAEAPIPYYCRLAQLTRG